MKIEISGVVQKGQITIWLNAEITDIIYTFVINDDNIRLSVLSSATWKLIVTIVTAIDSRLAPPRSLWSSQNRLKSALLIKKHDKTRICAAEMAVRYAALSACRKVHVCHFNSLGGAT